MLNEEEKKIVEYLRMSPKYSLKRDAADLIERLEKKNNAAGLCLNDLLVRCERVTEMNGILIKDIEVLKNKKSSIWQVIKEKFK